MKSQRRHELQHNTLDAELTKALDWLKKHYFKLAVGALVIVIAVLIGVWIYNTQASKDAERRHMAALWAQMGADAPGLTAEVKADLLDGDGALAAQAHLLAGRDALLETQKDGSQEAAAELRSRARTYFQKVISSYGSYPDLVGRAWRGLALLDEQEQKWGDALKSVNSLLAVSGLNDGYPIYRWALDRKRALEQRLEAGSTQVVKLAAVVPPRRVVADRARQFLFLIGGENVTDEQLEPHIRLASDVKPQIEKVKAVLGDSRIRVEDENSHVVGDRALVLSTTFSEKIETPKAPQPGDAEKAPEAGAAPQQPAAEPAATPGDATKAPETAEGDAAKAPEPREMALLIYMDRIADEWKVSRVDAKPAEEARKEFQAFTGDN